MSLDRMLIRESQQDLARNRVVCPWCAAVVGDYCRDRYGIKTTLVHAERLTAAGQPVNVYAL